MRHPEILASLFGTAHTSHTQKKKARKPRKKTESGESAKDIAKSLYAKWSANPSLYKNKAAFNRDVQSKDLCNDIGTANKWLSDFIVNEKTSDELRNLLCKPKKV